VVVRKVSETLSLTQTLPKERALRFSAPLKIRWPIAGTPPKTWSEIEVPWHNALLAMANMSMRDKKSVSEGIDM